MPCLSVLMPVFNQPRFALTAIQSILSQTFRDFELLVMDDGSTDDTPEILKRCAASDERMRLFLRPRRGLPATRNELLQLAKYPVVAWLDSDDVATPRRLERQLDAMLADDDLLLLGTGVAGIDADGRLLERREVITGATNVKRRMADGCKIAQTTSMMRREPILAMGGYRSAFSYSQDYDLFLRISERGKIDNLDFVGVHYRFHANNVTAKFNPMQRLLADLARASHSRRLRGLPDPVDALSGPPDLFSEPVLDEMLGDTVNVYRALYQAGLADSDPTETLRTLVGSKVVSKQRKSCQQAILTLVRERPFDWLSAKALLRAGSLGPSRFVRQVLTPSSER